MLLRIIDRHERGSNAVDVVLEDGDAADGFAVDSFDSPFSPGFREILVWYFQNYPHSPSPGEGDKGCGEKIVKFGQYLGDALLGEDHDLSRLTHRIEESGYGILGVELESSRPEFFDEFWETLVLPDSKYVLSSVVAGFTRRFVGPDYRGEFPELRFELEFNSRQNDAIANMIDPGRSDTAEGRNKGSPLTILHILSHPEGRRSHGTYSHAFDLSVQLLAAEGAIHHEVHEVTSSQEFWNLLDNGQHGLHVLHLDVPVVLDSENEWIILGEKPEDHLEVRTLVKRLSEARIPLLCMDTGDYHCADPEGAITVNEGLAKIASRANQAGIGNVVGISHCAPPCVSGEGYKHFYMHLAKGFSISQALVEARKILQSQPDARRFSPSPLPFHAWPLFVQYGGQEVVFFDVPCSTVPLEQAQAISDISQRLFGFSASLLRAPLANVSDGLIVTACRNLAERSSSVLLQGIPGSGKTQTAHYVAFYLAHTGKIDFAFYFDFEQDFYSSDDMLSMIAPVLGLEAANTTGILDKLRTSPCMFVFDGLDTFRCSDEDRKEVSEFIGRLPGWGQRALFCAEVGEPFAGPTVTLTISPLLQLEQKALATRCLDRWNLAEKAKGEDLTSLLDATRGNPFLLTRAVPLLASLPDSELCPELRKWLSGDTEDPVQAFFEWRWASLPREQQEFLLLVSRSDRLILEIVMIACDREDSFEPAVVLLSSLGLKKSVAATLDDWEQSGFVSRVTWGRMIDPACKSFLGKLRGNSTFDSARGADIPVLFSQVICEGLRLLTRNVLQQQNQGLIHYLLANRRHWAEHFERLWFGGDYRSFLATKAVFDQLLRLANLSDESSSWSLDLLKRTPPAGPADDHPESSQTAWLILAGSALDASEGWDEAVIRDGVSAWQIWLDSFEGNMVAPSDVDRFGQATQFLEKYYSRSGDWNRSREVALRSYDFHIARKNWLRAIQSLRLLAGASVKLGDSETALQYEQKVIDEIPYEDAPPGFLVQQLLDTLFARMERGESKNAQAVLDQLKNRDDAQQVRETLDAVQADIYYQEGRYREALPQYCRMWERCISAGDQPSLSRLKARLLELEERLGTEDFERMFVEEVGEKVVRPREFA